jgi:hypothetical protein
VTDRGTTVTAQVVDADGAPAEFRTDDRWATVDGKLVRARWRSPVLGWSTIDGRPRPASASAVRDLAAGPFCYAELHVDEVVTGPRSW